MAICNGYFVCFDMTEQWVNFSLSFHYTNFGLRSYVLFDEFCSSCLFLVSILCCSLLRERERMLFIGGVH